MVVTNDAALAAKIDVLRRHGSPKKYHAEIVGYNSRLDALQAAILGVKLDYLDEWNRARQRAARSYDELLADLPVSTPYVASDVEHVYHQYTVRAPQRDALATHLQECDIGRMIYYPVPLHQQELYASQECGDGQTTSAGSLPNSEVASREVLSLPMYPELTDAQVEEVVRAIRVFYR
jgi:dTDP-4-amino-4,6-dideoxygalactose transaminase